MKKLLVICSILLAGCYIQTPAKILKHPSLYGVPIIIDTHVRTLSTLEFKKRLFIHCLGKG